MANTLSPKLIEHFELSQAEVNQVMLGRPVPGKVSFVTKIPNCDFCSMAGEESPGPIDFRSAWGGWANGCIDHYEMHRAEPGLGVGKAQIWLLRE